MGAFKNITIKARGGPKPDHNISGGSLTGLAEMNAPFDAMTNAMQKKIGRKATREGAKAVLVRARTLVPVKSGKLRKGLRVRSLKRSRTRFGHKVATPTREYLGIPAKDKHGKVPAYYPAVLEYGTKGGKRLESGGVSRPRVAKSYLRRALHEGRAEAVSVMQKVVAMESIAAASGQSTPDVGGDA